MTQLTRVELRRILARKIVHLSVLAIIASTLLTFWGLWRTVQPEAAFEQQARQELEQAHAEWEEYYDEESAAQCREDEQAERERLGDPTLEFGCEWEEPTLETILAGYTPPAMADLIRTTLQQNGYLVLLLALLAGSTATAAELSHRTMATWLTFEPRRDRVFGSKVLASGLITLPLTLLFLALVLLGIPLLYGVRGVEDSLTAAQWSEMAWTGGRIALVAAFLGMVGAAAGLLLRHTGVVLGIVVGYLLVVENMVRGLFPQRVSLLLSENLSAWVNDGTEIYSYVCDNSIEAGCREVVTPISLEHGALVVGLVGVVVIVLAWLVFRRRDVT